MEFIKWKEDLSVGVGIIDDQHKELFQHINNFYNSIVNKTNKEGVMQVISNLENYTRVHFSFEKQAMRNAGYADIAAHIKEHEAFVAKVADFKERFYSGRLLLSLEVTTFIKDWITNHIKVSDQKYRGIVV
jgi:hemerythrin